MYVNVYIDSNMFCRCYDALLLKVNYTIKLKCCNTVQNCLQKYIHTGSKSFLGWMIGARRSQLQVLRSVGCLQKCQKNKFKIGMCKGGCYSSKPGCAAGSQAICDEKLLRVASMGGLLME